MRSFMVFLLSLSVPLSATAAGQDVKVPPGTQEIKINVAPATPAAPTVTLTLGPRHAHVTPLRKGCHHTGGGNIDVQQPSSDTLVITMSGIAVATPMPCGVSFASMDFDLEQCFEVVFENKDIKAAKLTVESRLIGLLRSAKKGQGYAEESNACLHVDCDHAGEVIHLCLPPHMTAAGENLSLNDHEGPCNVPITPGKYTLHQTFHIAASTPHSVLPCKGPSAEFAPDPALDPLWISYWEPFHGATKKDFGFQITIKVAEDTNVSADGNGNGDKKEEGDKKMEKMDKNPTKLQLPAIKY
jgi:hypothetical protein